MAEHHGQLEGGRFELLEILGQGGMGVVYRAIDRERGVQVAIKTLRGATPEGVLRFKTEFRALRDIKHPNLIELGEMFETDGAWFFTMELVRGVGLLSWIRGDVQTSNDAAAIDSDFPTLVTEETDPLAELAAPAALPAPRCDERRLRRALAGLASGLVALHRAGKIHRDVKPSNVIVETTTGRAVLLDFGVVAELQQARESSIIGTVKYMAPEQARGDLVGPAADWYAFGVVLFQALSGRLPLSAPSEALVVLKQHAPAPPVTRFVSGVPPELASLSARLLDRDPANRPDHAEIFAALGVAPTPEEAPEASALFVGRQSELRALAAAELDARVGGVYVEIEGESGVGKTALVDRFCEIARASRDATILRGRCHHRERLAFNAFDGIVHELARWLIGRDAIALPLPHAVADLLAVFPDLAAVPALAPDRHQRESEPGEVRGRAFGALGELLARIAVRGPLVLVIDDIQWADHDSLTLLAEILRARSPLLVIATRRAETGGNTSNRVIASSRRITLGGLARADAEQLVGMLVASAATETAHLVTESGGHPLFLAELVRHRAAAGGPARLDEAIWARASALDPETRHMLAAIAVGAPLGRELAIAVSELDPTTAESALDRLVRAQLIRLHGLRQTDLVEPFHDRVREAVLAHESPQARRALHGKLAGILEERGASPDVLFTHFEAAGDRERASAFLLIAAERALKSFAFARAAELFGHALATLELSASQRCTLLGKVAEALVNDGRTAEAGARYLEAAQLAEPSSSRQLNLLRRAAERFLMSGRLDLGLQTAKAVLARIDMVLPTSRARTLAGIAWNQVQTRNLEWSRRTALDPRSLDAEVCWSIGAGLAMVDSALGAYFSGRAAVLALRHGTSLQIARSMSAATVGAALLGRRERALRLHDAARRAAAEDGTAIATWYARLAETTTLFVLDNEFRRCLASASTLELEWYAAGRGPGWETDVVRHFGLASLQMLGELTELANRVTILVDGARRTGNLFQEVTLRVRFAVRHLLVDRPEVAELDVADALASWQPSADSFGNQRAWALWSRTRILLYAGDLGRLAELDDEWHRMRRSLVGRVPALKVEWYHAYGTYLLGRALDARVRRRAGEHAAFCRAAARIADELGRLDFPAVPAATLLLRAGIAWVHGDESIGPLRAAIDAVTERGLVMFVPFLRRRLGEAIGGSDGAELVASADAEARAQGFVRPDRGAEIAIPSGMVL